MSKERRLGRGLEALLGRAAGPIRPQIHVPPEEDAASGVTPIEVNQQPVVPHRIEPVRRPDSGIPLDSPRDHHGAAEAAAPSEPWREPAEPPIGSGAYGLPETHEPLSASFEASATDVPVAPATGTVVSDGTDVLLHVDIHLIETNPFQPRKDFLPEEIDQLSRSIEEHGLLQPLLVRRVDEAYQLIAGERRLRAAQAAGWREVPVKVVEAQERQMSELALVENLQRKDLNAMEKAASFKRYLELNGCTQEELAGRLKLDRSTIANLVRLLELPEAVQDAVRQGKISQGHARALLPLGDESQQIAFTERIQRETLSVRATERLVQETIEREDAEPLAVVGRDGSSRRTKPVNEQIAALEQEFRSGLGMKVKLTHNAKGRGKLVIQFGSHEEFERLRRHILGPEMPAERAG